MRSSEVEATAAAAGPAGSLFSESTGRIVFTVAEDDAAAAAALVEAHGGGCLGSVEASECGGHLRLVHETCGFEVTSDSLRARFKEGLHGL